MSEIATRQHGVVAVEQLRQVGLDKYAVHKRAKKGVLHRLHYGVYAVGHCAPSREREWMAAVLACGEGAVLSHGCAAALWGLLRPADGLIDISIPSQGGRRRRRGIRVYRRRSLGADRVTKRLEIPVTTPAQTIADIDGVLPARLVRRATRQAELAGYRLEIETDRTRSDLERDFLRLCRRYDLPAPEVNVKIGRWTVDFLWREKLVVAETDGYRYHRGSVAFEDDHARDLDLRRMGYDVRRFTYRQVHDRPAEVAADLRDVLGLAS